MSLLEMVCLETEFLTVFLVLSLDAVGVERGSGFAGRAVT
jgi:hypothetical protein